MEESTNLWVFGYGSLVWKPGFQPGQLVTGYVEGFARRLWQGNETHRGRPGRPGRVTTLVAPVTCRAGRRTGFFYWNIFLIMSFISCLAFATFSVHPKYVHNRLQLR